MWSLNNHPSLDYSSIPFLSVNFAIKYCIEGNFSRGKLWRIYSKLNCIWRNKVWKIQVQSVAMKVPISGATSNWRVKLW